jgi:signal-transduction protein with cAMP-binding, CBS, and nucleotidyltransferase domain
MPSMSAPLVTARRCSGRPRCPYALLVLGSGARRESTLRTDQDHALVVADGAPPGADGWFAALAEHLAATLEQCGLVRCPGDIMATTRPGGSRWGPGRSNSSAG